MKNFGNWILRNLSNIFGIIGIGLTFYLGVFYVPNWLEEAKNEKIINAQENLIQSVKELIYSDSICTLTEIEVLIKAKEIELNQKYPLSTSQSLICVQESFMQDKFLPLEKRKKLIKEIETLKTQIKPDNNTNQQIVSKSKTTGWEGFLSIFLSIIGGLVGIISFYIKYRTDREKQEEIDNQMAQSESINYSRENAFQFEKGILKHLTNKPGIKIIDDFRSPNHEFDIIFEFKGKEYFVEIKYYSRSKVGLGSIERFLSSLQGKEGVFWFIYNTDLTEMVKRRVDEINMISTGRSIQLIKIDTLNDFERKLNELLPTT